MLLTGWLVSGSPPGTLTSVWPAVFMGVGLIYAGLAPVFLNVGTQHLSPRRFLVMEAGFHLLPALAVTWATAALVQGTAYAYLARWCWWGLGACAMLGVGGFLHRVWQSATSPNPPA